MQIWKHKDAATFPGTWLIASNALTSTQIILLIKSAPQKYGKLQDWSPK